MEGRTGSAYRITKTVQGKMKSISKSRDSSERTYQHSNFMDCGMIRKNKGQREERMPEDSVNE